MQNDPNDRENVEAHREDWRKRGKAENDLMLIARAGVMEAIADVAEYARGHGIDGHAECFANFIGVVSEQFLIHEAEKMSKERRKNAHNN